MIPYIIAIGLCIIINTTLKNTRIFKNRFWEMFVSILPLTIMSGIRFDVGYDYIPIYNNGFFYIGKYNIDYFSEPCFLLLNKLLYFLFKDPLSLFLFMSIILSIFFSLCYKEYDETGNAIPYILLFVLSRYFFISMNILRQGVSMIILLYSVKFAQTKNFKKYFVCVMLATSIHFFSILYLPIYFILKLDFSKRKNLQWFFVTVPIFLMGIFLLSVISKFSKYFSSMFGNDGTFLIGEMIISITILLTYVFVGTKTNKYKYTDVFMKINIIGFLVLLISPLLPTPDRIYWYFYIQNIFLIPNLLKINFSDRKNRFIFSSLIYGSILLIFIIQTFSNGDGFSVFPYQDVINDRSEVGVLPWK